MKTPKISIQIGADTRKLKREMKNADGIVSKFTSAAKLGFAAATAAAGAFAFKIGKEGVQSAIEDQKSQAQLVYALGKTTKATEAAIAANEELIGKKQMMYGIDDVLLRSSMLKLTRVTGSLTKAQKLQNIALDVAYGANIDLEAATNLIVKAQQGAFRGFKSIGVVLDEDTIKTKDVTTAMSVLKDTFKGAAAAATDTMAVKLAILDQAWGEFEESVGYALLPGMQKLADWAASPAGAAALENFATGFADTISAIPANVDSITRAFENVGQVLDNITPDPGSPLNKILSLLTADITPNIKEITPAEYLGNLLTQQPSTGKTFAERYGNITINVNGSLDPVATARQVQKLLNQVPRSNIPQDISKRSK